MLNADAVRAEIKPTGASALSVTKVSSVSGEFELPTRYAIILVVDLVDPFASCRKTKPA